LVAQRIDAPAVPPGRKYGAGIRVLDHPRYRAVGDRDVQRHRDGAVAQNAEQQHRHLQTAVHEHGDAIAGGEPETLQAIRCARGLSLELRPGEPPLPFDQRIALAPPLSMQRNQVGQRHSRRLEPSHG
jgi:hypothetical protein